MNKNYPIQLWLARTDEFSFEALWHEYASCLPQQEREKVLAYKFDKDRILSLVSKVMLRTLLSSHFPAKKVIDWRFAANRFGKPFIDGNEEERRLQFNLSHTRGMVACALSIDNEIGVDIENTDERDSLLDIAPTVFTVTEISSLQAFSNIKDRIRHFFRLWTLKEAYIKYIGMGLSKPLQEFEFELREGKIVFTELNDRPAQTPPAFCSALIGQHALSIAVRPGNCGSANIDVRDFSDLKTARPTDVQFDLLSTNQGIYP